MRRPGARGGRQCERNVSHSFRSSPRTCYRRTRCLTVAGSDSFRHNERCSIAIRRKSMTTFTSWLLGQERTGAVTNELALVLVGIANACKRITSLVARAPIDGVSRRLSPPRAIFCDGLQRGSRSSCWLHRARRPEPSDFASLPSSAHDIFILAQAWSVSPGRATHPATSRRSSM